MPIRLLALLFAVLSSSCWASSGVLDLVSGNVSVERSGHPVKTEAGTAIEEGDIITCGDDGEAHLDMIDGGALALRPGSKLQIESYQTTPEEEHVVLRLLGGAYRSVTGWIAKVSRPKYQIITPTATIGIRGTDYEVMVDADGTYSVVSEGSIGMRGLDQTQELEIRPGMSAFATRVSSRHVERSAIPQRLFRAVRFEGRFNRFFAGDKAQERISKRLAEHVIRLRKTRPDAAKRFEKHLLNRHPDLHQKMKHHLSGRSDADGGAKQDQVAPAVSGLAAGVAGRDASAARQMRRAEAAEKFKAVREARRTEAVEKFKAGREARIKEQYADKEATASQHAARKEKAASKRKKAKENKNSEERK